MRGTTSSDELSCSPDSRQTTVINEYRLEMREFDATAAEPSLN